jgi:predicted DNA binding CopG/RHH family protein
MANVKHNFKLTPGEKRMEDSLLKHGYSSVPNVEAEKSKAIQVAKNTVAKNRAITIRVSDRNLMRLKAAAAREGVPYQTFVSSLIQKNT